MSFQDWTVEAIAPQIDGFLEPLLKAAQLDLTIRWSPEKTCKTAICFLLTLS